MERSRELAARTIVAIGIAMCAQTAGAQSPVTKRDFAEEIETELRSVATVANVEFPRLALTLCMAPRTAPADTVDRTPRTCKTATTPP